MSEKPTQAAREAAGRLAEARSVSESVACGIVQNAIDAATSSKDEVITELAEALEKARDMIASLPEDAFGYNHLPDGETYWPIRDEAIDRFNAAIAKVRADEPQQEKP